MKINLFNKNPNRANNKEKCNMPLKETKAKNKPAFGSVYEIKFISKTGVFSDIDRFAKKIEDHKFTPETYRMDTYTGIGQGATERKIGKKPVDVELPFLGKPNGHISRVLVVLGEHLEPFRKMCGGIFPELNKYRDETWMADPPVGVMEKIVSDKVDEFLQQTRAKSFEIGHTLPITGQIGIGTSAEEKLILSPIGIRSSVKHTKPEPPHPPQPIVSGRKYGHLTVIK